MPAVQKVIVLNQGRFLDIPAVRGALSVGWFFLCIYLCMLIPHVKVANLPLGFVAFVVFFSSGMGVFTMLRLRPPSFWMNSIAFNTTKALPVMLPDVHAIPGNDDDEGLVVLADGGLRKFIRCDGMGSLLFDDATREHVANSVTELANRCQSDIQIIVTSRNIPSEERPKADSKSALQIPKRTVYVVIGYQPPEGITGTDVWSNSASMYVDEHQIDALNALVASTFFDLSKANLHPVIASRREVRTLLFSHLSPSHFDRGEPTPESTDLLAEGLTLCQGGLQVHPNYLQVDSKFVGSEVLYDLPPETWIGWLDDLLVLKQDYTISLFLHHCDKQQVIKRLKDHYQFMRGSAMTPETVQVSQKYITALHDLTNTSTQLIDLSMYVTIYSDELSTLVQQMEHARAIMKQRGASFEPARFLQLDAWVSSLPLGLDKPIKTHRVLSPLAGTFWPCLATTTDITLNG